MRIPRVQRPVRVQKPEPELDAWLVAEADKVLDGPRLSGAEVRKTLGLPYKAPRKHRIVPPSKRRGWAK